MTAGQRTRRVLVAEPDALAAQSIAAYLAQRGYEVALVASGAAVLDHATPDALIVQVELPDRSGFELCAELSARAALPWTALVAARPSIDAYRSALRSGVRELLEAPVRLEELERALRAGIPSSRRAQDAQRRAFARTYDAHPRSIPGALRDLLAFALRGGLGPTVRARIGSAAAEVLENAWEHGYARLGGPVHVSASFEDREFVVEIEDEGVGCDGQWTAAHALESPRDSGIARAGALAEDMRIESRPGVGARVRLAFASYRVDFDDPAGGLDLSEWDYLAPEFARRLDIELAAGAGSLQLSPALAVVVGRLLSGPPPLVRAMRALWS